MAAEAEQQQVEVLVTIPSGETAEEAEAAGGLALSTVDAAAADARTCRA